MAPKASSTDMGATGRWGEPRGAVSEAPARAVPRWCVRDRPLGRASGSGFRHACPCVGAFACARQAAGESLRAWFPRRPPCRL